jgi:hypothetical protein
MDVQSINAFVIKIAHSTLANKLIEQGSNRSDLSGIQFRRMIIFQVEGFARLTQRGLDSGDAKLERRIAAFHFFAIGSPISSRRLVMNSYAFLFSEAECPTSFV